MCIELTVFFRPLKYLKYFKPYHTSKIFSSSVELKSLSNHLSFTILANV